jgi:putative inorganic carbon (HCO3(-)) transporter
MRQFFYQDPVLYLSATAMIALSVFVLSTPHPYLALLIGPGLLVLGWLLHRPQLAMFLVLLAIPFDKFRGFSDAWPSLTISKLAGFLAIVVAMLMFTFRILSVRELRSNLWPWLLAFLVINLIAAGFSPYPETSLDTLRKLGASLMVFALSLVFLRDERRLELATDLIIISVAASALMSIAGYGFELDSFTREGRATGGADDPNVFSSIVLFGLPFMAHRLFHAQQLHWRLTYAALVLVSVTAVMLTFSRGGSMILLFTLLLLLFEHRRRFSLRYLGLLVFVLAALGAALIIATPTSYWERQLSLLDTAEDRSIGRRTSYLYVAGEAFTESPLLGHGPGSFRDKYAESDHAQQFITSWNRNVRRYAHNTYLEVLVGSGLLGLTLFSGFLIQSLRNYSRAAQHFHNAGQEGMASLIRSYRLAMIVLLTYFLILSQFQIKYLWIGAAISSIFLALAKDRTVASTEAIKKKGTAS